VADVLDDFGGNVAERAGERMDEFRFVKRGVQGWKTDFDAKVDDVTVKIVAAAQMKL